MPLTSRPRAALTRRSLLPACVLVLGLAVAGCDDDDRRCGPGADLDAGPIEPSVQIGMRRSSSDNTFVPLREGGDIKLSTFGQGGVHADLAVRCIGFGNRAYVDLSLENLRDNTVIMYPMTSRPSLLRCVAEPEGACDLLPIYFMTGGLALPKDKDGLPVRVRATCRNDAGAVAEARLDGVLRADALAAAVGRPDEDAGPADLDAGQ